AARGDVNSRVQGSQFSPRAALIFKPDANNDFRLTFNRAYSSPTSFSFFLDQYSGQTPAPGMPVQIMGNPPKVGWSFARSCGGVEDYGPLGASFANTWELGYKGFLARRLSLTVDAWFQKRPADPTSQLINPGVLFNPQQLGAFLGQGIAQALIAAGQSPAQAQATAAAAAGALTPLMAAIPVGATAFTNPLYTQPYLVFSYRPATGYVN